MGLTYCLVAAAAVIGRTAAAQCSASTTTIQNQGDASALASCKTFQGSIAIQTDVANSIAINGVSVITGDLTADNNNGLTELSFDSLTKIEGSWEMNGMITLTTLSAPDLQEVGSISWTALPGLAGLSFNQNGVQVCPNVKIINTNLNSLEGLNMQSVDTMVITNNKYLQMLSMQLGNVSNSLDIDSNGPQMQVSLPNLIWANNFTVRAVDSVDTPSLAAVNGSLGYYESTFSSVSAPNLTSVGGTLSFVDNDNLGNISYPALKTVGGGLQVANNTKLESISFQNVKSVGGALDFNGAFNAVQLPALADVRGAFNLQSSQNIDSVCNHFSSLHGNNDVIKGTYTCKDVSSPSGVTGGGSGGSSTGSGSSTTSSGAASPMYKAVPITGFMGVIAAIFGLL